MSRCKIGPDLERAPKLLKSRSHGGNADTGRYRTVATFCVIDRKTAPVVADRQMEVPLDRLDDDSDLRRLRVAEYVRERLLNDPQHRELARVR
jgi:hypothetical protein